MNRNHLKIIALVSMLADHVGTFLLDNFWPLRLIGRLAFPLFAFFIAEGWHHTSNRKRYVLFLLLFAIISQVPYAFLLKIYNLNVLFTFLTAILCIYMLENYKKHDILYTFLLTLIAAIALVGDFFNFLDYGLFGLLLILVFYFARGSKLKFFGLSALCLIALSIRSLIMCNFALIGLAQFFGLASLPLIALYNGQRGSANLKWLFYVFYPLHLTAIMVLTLI